MSKFGKKFTCWKCSTKFYDMNKPQAKCPKCGSDPEDDPNKGLPLAPAPTFGEELVEDLDEELPEEMEDEELEDEGLEEEPAGGEEEF